MNKHALLNEKNDIYVSQFSTLAIIAALTFKVVMLPSYLASAAGHLAFLSVAVMMLVDVVMYAVTFYIVKRINLLKENNKFVVGPVMLAILILSFIRLLVLFSETIGYTSSTLFDQGKMIFILIALLAVLSYVVYKGGNVLSRLAQLIFIVAAFAIVTMLALLRTKMDFTALLPLNYGYDGLTASIDKHFIWYGDFIPLLFLHVVPNKRGKDKKWTFPVSLVIIFVSAVLFIVLFQAIYGDAARYTNFAFNKIAVFNKISELIGPTNFPIIIAWILMSIIKLSLLLYTTTMSLAYFIRSKFVSLAVNVLAVGLTVGIAMPNVNYSYEFATGSIRYVVCALQYSVPILLAIYVRIKERTEKTMLLPAILADDPIDKIVKSGESRPQTLSADEEAQ